MHRRTLLAVALAAMLALAGCAGSTTPGAPTAGGDGGGADGSTRDGGTVATGTVQFYVSDQPAAIEDFEHLNVTITQIGFQRADDGDDATDVGNGTATPAGANATATAANTTPTATPGDGATPAEAGTDAEEDEVADDGDDGRAGWETVEVDSRTVDLTRLRGDNATLVGTPEIAAGEYTTVFVHVDSINATLTTGESVNVKLPSQKLQLNRGFTLEPNGTVQFVYDINVVKAGNSGKYILKPVISQSGPDQPVEEVDGDGADDGAGPDGSDEREDEEGDREDDVGTASDGTEESEATETGDGERGGPPDDRGTN